jgi:poly(3-hydroxybutyrate) depolymerase
MRTSKSLRRAIGVTFTFAFLITSCAHRAAPPPTKPTRPPLAHPEELRQTRLVTLPGGRKYYVFAPPGAPHLLPLVLVLHGLYLSPNIMASDSRFTSYAAQHDFVVTYGSGERASWNAGECCRRNRADDVRYLTDVVIDLEHRLPIDPHRVYVAGFSNGGMMALRMQCERPDLFAAVGVMSGDLQTACKPLPPRKAVPLHVRQINGSSDTAVPATGGYSEILDMTLPDVRAEGAELPARSQFVLTLVPGLEHQWATPANSSVDATDEFWRFFQQHAL